MVLVTGGTGLVGAHLLYQLSLKGTKIRATYRSADKIEKAKHVFSYYTDDVDGLFKTIEWIEADINDIPKLTQAFQSVTHVYHCAALVSFDPNDYYALRKSNIEGTANIVNLCLSHNIEKLCYVSSIATLGKPETTSSITENDHWNPEANNSVYGITKYGAEMEVWRGTQEGLDAVIVNPGVIVGPGFWREGSGSLFRLVDKGLKYYTDGVVGYVDVNDVVRAMIDLMGSEIVNQRYILVAENWSFKSFFDEIARQLNVKSPQKEAKSWLLQIAWRLDWLKYVIQRKRRRLTKQTVDSLLSKRQFNSDKIKNDLDFEFKPLSVSIQQSSNLYLRDYQ